MQDIDVALIKRKSLRGIIALTSRTFVLQVISFSATILLTIFLSPATFGVFYVVSAIIAFFGYFSDIGLAAALIQKKDRLTAEDLKTTFTIQQLLVTSVVIIGLVFSKTIADFYRLDASGLLLLQALIISFFISSLKTIPSILLERNLEFQKLILPQIIETLFFYIVAVVLAWSGYGIASFTWAVMARALSGLVAMYIISPWRISLGISQNVARSLLKFGIPFQMNSFLALLKDDLLTVFLGKILPFSQVGYIGWAKKWAEVPLRLIMDSVVRITFPAFSRMQHNKALLKTAIENTLYGLSVTIFPLSVFLLFFIKPLVFIFPKYIKWEPALTSFYLFTIASAIASLSTPLTNALNALGRIKVTLSLMALWTSLTWILTSVFVYFIGYNGVALSLLLITSTLLIVVHLVKQIVVFSFLDTVRTALLACVGQSLFYISLLSLSFLHSPPGLIITAAAGILLYLGIIIVLDKERVKTLMREFSPVFLS